jgi:hypothetical protein
MCFTKRPKLYPGLLAYRIWTIERNVSKIRASSHGTRTPILRVLVDAAILYSVVLFTMLICFVCSNNGQYIVLDMVSSPLTPLMGNH